MNVKALIAGAVSGFLAAFVVDLRKWSTSTGPFDWMVAAKSWLAGAISGAIGAAGLGVVS